MTEVEIREMAQMGNKLIELAIVELLRINPTGLHHSDIVERLDLRSSHNGGQTNYLTYSVLGNLMKRQIVIKEGERTDAVYRLI